MKTLDTDIIVNHTTAAQKENGEILVGRVNACACSDGKVHALIHVCRKVMVRANPKRKNSRMVEDRRDWLVPICGAGRVGWTHDNWIGYSHEVDCMKCLRKMKAQDDA
jgi:hypothetical protein